MIEKYPDKTVFGNYERAEVLRWINDFRYFTFARGGLNEFVNDGDEFVVSFSFSDKEDLRKKLDGIGISLNKIESGSKIFNRKKKATADNSAALPEPIEQFPEFAQPGFRDILGVSVYTWVGENFFWIAVSNTVQTAEWWKVTTADVEYCLKLEQLFDKAGLLSSRVYQTEQYGRFINRHNYPQYFTTPAESLSPKGKVENEN